MIPLPVLALVALAVYRGTLLVTGDRITRTPRRRLRAWLKSRTHRVTEAGNAVRCSCGWSASSQPSGQRHGHMVTVSAPVPRALVLPDSSNMDADLAAYYVTRAGELHYRDAQDTSRLGYLLECPWCVSMYLGTIGAAVAWAWPAGWWRWPALALAASGVTGLLATIAAPDENDDED
jgi:hypothetical protein